MSSEPETTRIVRSWLEDGATVLPDRVLDAVLDQLPATPQRRSWWSARRLPEMNNAIRLAIGAAAVVVASLVGISLMNGGSTPGVGGPTSPSPSPSPEPSASPSPSVRPSPSPWPSLPPAPTPQAGAFPAVGELSIGRHAFSQNGIPFSLEVSTSGWQSDGLQVAPDGGTLTKGDGTPQEVWMLLWSIDGVYTDPCGHVAAPPVSPSAADLAAAVASIPGFDVITAPTDVTLDGRPAKHVEVKLQGALGCSPEQFYMWYDNVRCGLDSPCYRWATEPGHQVNDVWIVEVDGKHIWIEAETLDSASPETVQEVQQMIASLQFE